MQVNNTANYTGINKHDLKYTFQSSKLSIIVLANAEVLRLLLYSIAWDCASGPNIVIGWCIQAVKEDCQALFLLLRQISIQEVNIDYQILARVIRYQHIAHWFDNSRRPMVIVQMDKVLFTVSCNYLLDQSQSNEMQIFFLHHSRPHYQPPHLIMKDCTALYKKIVKHNTREYKATDQFYKVNTIIY